jgi:ABC-type transporter Mla maintaining outer membrane lipid asymmetry ATPase subunit MlaF
MNDPAAVEFEHVFKTFGNRKILDDVSFKIRDGRRSASWAAVALARASLSN